MIFFLGVGAILGIAILFTSPKPREASTFSFMAPFSNEVWILLVVAYFIVSLCFFCLARMCPAEWVSNEH